MSQRYLVVQENKVDSSRIVYSGKGDLNDWAGKVPDGPREECTYNPIEIKISRTHDKTEFLDVTRGFPHRDRNGEYEYIEPDNTRSIRIPLTSEVRFMIVSALENSE